MQRLKSCHYIDEVSAEVGSKGARFDRHHLLEFLLRTLASDTSTTIDQYILLSLRRLDRQGSR